MTLMCEVCNGMESLSYSCPTCLQPADDQGKLSDYYGPYAPYRAIDDGMDNLSGDVMQRQCVHLAFCPACAASFPVPVPEKLQAE
ncbi:hypothetical protein PAESOLCIP111_02139 [Paenibacillus solanacearum]|uniref:Uncharacterized protein n=1 Tax=Paenibacillus solanacearum TaxID=2048548 RepID=A0A916JZY1_9BACL|nr:hypothetical protein [Paenibacillus solanacearum]CAG7618680.1 hypothetical protein PAESOLCIP111_02139 [Paenibacillus solanacearum]